MSMQQCNHKRYKCSATAKVGVGCSQSFQQELREMTRKSQMANNEQVSQMVEMIENLPCTSKSELYSEADVMLHREQGNQEGNSHAERVPSIAYTRAGQSHI